MSTHRMSLPETAEPEAIEHWATGGSDELLWLDGEEAHHAVRVKRLAEGDTVELLDGRGLICLATIGGLDKLAKSQGGGWRVGVSLVEARRHEPLRPSVEICAAVPKGDRFETMVSMVSQVGAASLRALETKRTVSEPRAGKLDRVKRVAAESAKQCGRAWTMNIAGPLPFAKAIQPPDNPAHASPQSAKVVLADASGGTYEPTGAEALRVLIGPEGGWTQRELDLAVEAGVGIARFGAHIMRIETAAVVACSAVLAAEHAHQLKEHSA